MNIALSLLVAYVLGSIPSAYWAGKRAKGIDMRKEGSGNLGATNTLRVLGPKWGIPVLIFDVLKGMAAIGIARTMVPDMELVSIGCGLVAILGHNCTIFLGFRGGGKGVAASAGVFAALTPIPFCIALAVFLIVLFSVRFMSLASISLALSLAVSGVVLYVLQSPSAPQTETLIFILVAATMIIVRHRSNIHRLLEGTEPKFSFKKKETP